MQFSKEKSLLLFGIFGTLTALGYKFSIVVMDDCIDVSGSGACMDYIQKEMK